MVTAQYERKIIGLYGGGNRARHAAGHGNNTINVFQFWICDRAHFSDSNFYIAFIFHSVSEFFEFGPVKPSRPVLEFVCIRPWLPGQLKEQVGIDPEGKSSEEKQKALRAYREGRYEQLLDAVYKRRGWNSNGVPTIDHLKKIGLDLPELIDVVAPFQI